MTVAVSKSEDGSVSHTAASAHAVVFAFAIPVAGASENGLQPRRSVAVIDASLARLPLAMLHALTRARDAGGTGREARVTTSMTLNGLARTVSVEPHHTLLEALRDDLGLTGAKECCLVGECGACTVRLDDRIVDSCLVLAVEADGGEVTTVEGLAEAQTLTRLQTAFVEKGAVQCGFCIPGQLMAGDDLLRRLPHPSHGEIEEGLAGNSAAAVATTRSSRPWNRLPPASAPR